MAPNAPAKSPSSSNLDDDSTTSSCSPTSMGSSTVLIMANQTRSTTTTNNQKSPADESKKLAATTTNNNNNTDSQHMHVCRLCNKLLSSSSSLDRHMLTHSGERPFVCKRCYMTFTTNGNMHRHMRTHLHKDSLARQQLEQQLKSLVAAGASTSPSPMSNSAHSISSPFQQAINPAAAAAAAAVAALPDLHLHHHHHHHSQQQHLQLQLDPDIGQLEDEPLGLRNRRDADEEPAEGADEPEEADEGEEAEEDEGHEEEEEDELTSNMHMSIASYDEEFSLDSQDIDMSLSDNNNNSRMPYAGFNNTSTTTSSALTLGDHLGNNQQVLENRNNHHLHNNQLPPLVASGNSKNSFLPQHHHHQQHHLNKHQNLPQNHPLVGHTLVASGLSESINNESVNSNGSIDDANSIISAIGTSATNGPQSINDEPMGLNNNNNCSSSNNNNINNSLPGQLSGPLVDGEIIEDISQSYVKTANPNAARKGGKRNRHCYKCKLCTYSSVDRCTLVRHLRIHSGERPYICGICRYAFTTKANCERHVRKRHKKQYNSLGGAGGGGVKGSNGGGRSLIITDHSNHQTIPVKVNPVAAQTISQTLQRIQEKQQHSQVDDEPVDNIERISAANKQHQRIQHHQQPQLNHVDNIRTNNETTSLAAFKSAKRKHPSDEELDQAVPYQRRRLGDKHVDPLNSARVSSRKSANLQADKTQPNPMFNPTPQSSSFVGLNTVPEIPFTNELFVNLMAQLQQVMAQHEAGNSNSGTGLAQAPQLTGVPHVSSAIFLANMLAAGKQNNGTQDGGQAPLSSSQRSLLSPKHLSQQLARLRNYNANSPFFIEPFSPIDLAAQALDLSCKFQSSK